MPDKTHAWVVARFAPTTFFSLKPASSTSSGGKTLLLPTPFALKMALLDAALRTMGEADGKKLFPGIRDLRIAVQPPPQAVVNNTFIKILRPHKAGLKDITGTGLLTPMGNTIAFREYVSLQGELRLAFQGMSAEQLIPLLFQINYFGKRGGFFQLQAVPQIEDELDEKHYLPITESTFASGGSFLSDGLLQMLDDCGPKMTFAHADIYSGKRIRLGKERILHHVVLPYRLVRSSKSYSYYERI